MQCCDVQSLVLLQDIRIPNPDFLLACMAFESGMSFCSSIRNAASGATGLIQFMPSTARGLGTTTVRVLIQHCHFRILSEH